MISEGSCDTQDWSNEAENAALHHINKLHLNTYKKRTKIIIIFHNWSEVTIVEETILNYITL